ncbi:hypothetical protein [Halosimplex sp. J119]
MNRRRFLAATALSASLCGCRTRGSETPASHDETENSTPTETETATDIPTTATTQPTSPAPTATDDCQWPDMCEGSQIVEVDVSSRFSGDVTLEADCRSEAFAVEPGESVLVERKQDAESCRVRLLVDGEEAYSEDIPGYKRVTLTVGSDGEVEVEGIVY